MTREPVDYAVRAIANILQMLPREDRRLAVKAVVSLQAQMDDEPAVGVECDLLPSNL